MTSTAGMCSRHLVARSKHAELQKALRGRFREHHAVMIGMALDHVEYLEASIGQLDERIDALFAANTSEAGVPFSVARDRLATIPVIAKRAAESIIAEIGVDMSRFPTAGHLASWAGLAPGSNITGGKRRSGKTTKGDRWLGEILNQCAWAASRKRDSYLSAQFWRLARRIGKKKAAVADALTVDSLHSRSWLAMGLPGCRVRQTVCRGTTTRRGDLVCAVGRQWPPSPRRSTCGTNGKLNIRLVQSVPIFAANCR